MTLRYWVTTLKPGDVISLGAIVLRVKRTENGKLKLVAEVPDDVKITKQVASK